MYQRVQLLLVSLVLLQGCAQPAASPTAIEIKGVRSTVQDGDTFIAGTPTREGLTQMKSRGVTAVIDFRDTPEEVAAEKAVAAELGLDYVNIPMRPDEITQEMATLLMEQMSRHKHEKVLLHCSGGNRAAAMYGVYLGFSGKYSTEDAIRRAKQTGLRNPKTESQLKARLAEKDQAAHGDEPGGSSSR
jgi:protein tyrosine phosphatase (PTP) superfamily phosphohydrolase (DUF442 family)